MMKNNLTKYVLLAGFLLFILALISILRPVPIVSENEAIVVSGKVSSIHEGGVKDVVFKLENTDKRYYINRGLENGLVLNDLKERLIGNEVVMKYPKY